MKKDRQFETVFGQLKAEIGLLSRYIKNNVHAVLLLNHVIFI